MVDRGRASRFARHVSGPPIRLPQMPRQRRVPFPPDTTSASVEELGLTGRRWTRWAVVNQGGKRVGWVTEGPRGGQIYGPGGEAHPRVDRSCDGRVIGAGR